jgi:hypothetical protein
LNTGEYPSLTGGYQLFSLAFPATPAENNKRAMNAYYRYFWFSFTGGVRRAGGRA